MSTNGGLHLSEVRPRMIAALQPAGPDDPDVLPDYADAVSPPALMVLWGDPWLTPETFGTCSWVARAQILAMAWRIDIGPASRKAVREKTRRGWGFVTQSRRSWADRRRSESGARRRPPHLRR